MIMRNTRSFEFFLKHQQKHYECCKYFQLMEFKIGDIICEYQSEPDFFYFLLEGYATVFLKKTIAYIDVDKANCKVLGPQQWESMQDKDYKLLGRAYFQGDVCKFKKISVLQDGASFGELGIIYNKPRIALIACRNRAYIAVLRKYHYLRIFCESENQYRKAKRYFIFAHFFDKFRDLKYEICYAILYSFKYKSYRINDFVCRYGEPFNGLFLIKSGEFVLQKNNHSKTRQVSIVSKGFFLCYQEWKRTVEKDSIEMVSYSAKVISAEAKVYALEWSEIRKIFNFKSIVKEMDDNVCYIEFVKNMDEEPVRLPTYKNEEEDKENNYNYVRGVKEQIKKYKIFIRYMKAAMLSSLLCCDPIGSGEPENKRKMKFTKQPSLVKSSVGDTETITSRNMPCLRNYV